MDLAQRISNGAVAALDLAPLDGRFDELSRRVLQGGATRFASVVHPGEDVEYVIPVGVPEDTVNFGALVVQPSRVGLLWREGGQERHLLVALDDDTRATWCPVVVGGEVWTRFDLDDHHTRLSVLTPPTGSAVLRDTLVERFRASESALADPDHTAVMAVVDLDAGRVADVDAGRGATEDADAGPGATEDANAGRGATEERGSVSRPDVTDALATDAEATLLWTPGSDATELWLSEPDADTETTAPQPAVTADPIGAETGTPPDDHESAPGQPGTDAHAQDHTAVQGPDHAEPHTDDARPTPTSEPEVPEHVHNSEATEHSRDRGEADPAAASPAAEHPHTADVTADEGAYAESTHAAPTDPASAHAAPIDPASAHPEPTRPQPTATGATTPIPPPGRTASGPGQPPHIPQWEQSRGEPIFRDAPREAGSPELPSPDTAASAPTTPWAVPPAPVSPWPSAARQPTPAWTGAPGAPQTPWTGPGEGNGPAGPGLAAPAYGQPTAVPRAAAPARPGSSQTLVGFFIGLIITLFVGGLALVALLMLG